MLNALIRTLSKPFSATITLIKFGAVILLGVFLFVFAWFASKPIVISVPMTQLNAYEVQTSYKYWSHLSKEELTIVSDSDADITVKIKNISTKEFLTFYLQSPLKTLKNPRIKIEEKSVFDLLVKGQS